MQRRIGAEQIPLSGSEPASAAAFAVPRALLGVSFGTLVLGLGGSGV